MKKILIVFLASIGFSSVIASNAFAAGLNANVDVDPKAIMIKFDKDVKVNKEDLTVASAKPDKVQFLLDIFDFQHESQARFAESLKAALKQDKITISSVDNKNITIKLEQGALDENAFRMLDLGNKDGIYRVMFKLDPKAISTNDGSTLVKQDKTKQYRIQFTATKKQDGDFDYANATNQFLNREQFEAIKNQPAPVAPVTPAVPATPDEKDKNPADQPAVAVVPDEKDKKSVASVLPVNKPTDLSAPNTGVKSDNYNLAILGSFSILGAITYFIIKKM